MSDFEGRTLSWAGRGDCLEVELHRPPCNEIGSETLDELEALADHMKGGASGARTLILHSRIPQGFSAGADLRELYDGIRERRQQGVPHTDIRRDVRAFLDRIHLVFDTLDTASMTTIAAV